MIEGVYYNFKVSFEFYSEYTLQLLVLNNFMLKEKQFNVKLILKKSRQNWSGYI